MSVYSEITPEIARLAGYCKNPIDPNLYTEYNVKRGLRDVNGQGVLAGLTAISTITSSRIEDGVKVPCRGVLRYRGIDITELTRGFISDNRFGFE